MKLSSQKTNILYGFFIVFFCLLAYLNSFRNVNFLIDDWDLIVNNERISHPQYLLYEFFPQLDPSGVPQHYYRPLISVVIAMSYWICGLNVGGYHIINWILLCLASLSAYILINKYFQNALLAFLSALFCAIHPFNSYIVNNASAGFCALQLAFLCWSAILFKSYNDQPERKRYLAVSVSLYTLALLFHDNALTFPAFLLMLAFLVIKNNTATRLLMRLAPYFIVSIIFYAIKKNYSATMGNMLNSETITLWQYFASVARLMAWYFEKLVTGKEVVFIWATHTVVKNVLWWNLGLLSAMLLCLRVYFSEKIDSVIRFAAGSFLLSILAVGVACRFEPVHGWITEPSWLSFAAISFFALLSLCFLKIRDFLPKFIFAPTLAIYVGTLLFNSWTLNNVWATEEKYCKYWAQQAPGFTTPLSFLASSYIREGDLGKGEAVLLMALKESAQPILYYKLGMIYYSRQQLDAAAEYFNKALALAPKSVTLRLLLEEIDKKKKIVQQ